MTNIKLKNDNPELLHELQNILSNYLNQKSNMSLNGLSKKCSISEPTLRRIYKGQIKTLPTVTTILDILTTVTGESNTDKISKKYPGPISDFLDSVAPQSEGSVTEYNVELNNELKSSHKYLIYKLASNAIGVTQKKVTDLFGVHGISALDELLSKGFVNKTGDSFFSKFKNFTGSHQDFISNFKAVADFIKIKSSIVKVKMNPVLANYSESVSEDAYKEIVAIQKKSLQRIREIMSKEESKGAIPLFVLVAVDTLDQKTAYEIDEEIKSKKH